MSTSRTAIYYTSIFIVCFAVSTATHANVNHREFMDACVAANDDKPICQCIADQWITSLTPADKQLAKDFLHAGRS